jgi:ferrous iron transport protein A
MTISLAELTPNKKAIIDSIEDESINIKLMEMGFITGEPVLLEIVAPLGDPLSIMIGSTNLSIRKSEAEKIFVTCSEEGY